MKVGLQKSIQGAFRQLSDLVTLVTYVQATPGAYDATTDTRTVTTVEYPNVRAMKVRMSEEERASFVANKKAEKLLIAYLDLPLVPQLTDYVLIDGERWEVRKLTPPPADTLHILFIQEP